MKKYKTLHPNWVIPNLLETMEKAVQELPKPTPAPETKAKKGKKAPVSSSSLSYTIDLPSNRRLQQSFPTPSLK